MLSVDKISEIDQKLAECQNPIVPEVANADPAPNLNKSNLACLDLSRQISEKIDTCIEKTEKIQWNEERCKLEFKNFMKFLDESGKKEWTPNSLKEWQPKFYDKFNKIKGKDKWRYVIEKFVDPADLRRHPFALVYPEWNDEIIRQRFKDFMCHLDEKKQGQWTISDLKAWSPKFAKRLDNKFKGKDRWQRIIESYIVKADLFKHPFKLEATQWSEERIIGEFSKFMRYLDEQNKGAWTPNDLEAWSSTLFHELDKLRVKNRWNYICGKFINQNDLSKHPLVTLERWSDEKIKATLAKFFQYLRSKKIREWNFVKLKEWREGDKKLGRNLIEVLIKRNKDWLITLILNISIKDLRDFKFTHKYGKTLPEAPISNDSTVYHRRINTSDAAYIPGSTDDPEQLLADQELEQKLYDAIEELPPDQKALAEAVLAGDEAADINSVISALRCAMLSKNEQAELEMSQAAAE